MEAKDTVMTPEQMIPMKHKWEIRDAQAEISFKAGIREVVEWLKVNEALGRAINDWDINDKWQAKLKEWGIV